MRDPRLFHLRGAGEMKMDNPEKRTTKVQEDEEKQRENTTLNVLVTIIHKQTQITQIRHEPSYR